MFKKAENDFATRLLDRLSTNMMNWFKAGITEAFHKKEKECKEYDNRRRAAVEESTRYRDALHKTEQRLKELDERMEHMMSEDEAGLAIAIKQAIERIDDCCPNAAKRILENAINGDEK